MLIEYGGTLGNYLELQKNLMVTSGLYGGTLGEILYATMEAHRREILRECGGTQGENLCACIEAHKAEKLSSECGGIVV